MFVEQNECVITLIEEHNLWTLKRRRTLGSDEAWGAQIVDAENENAGIDTNQDDLYVFFLDQAWDRLSKSYFYLKNGFPVTFFGINESWPCWKY